ncbi:MAG TPA: ABC transporter ATP-binding protein [Pseudonocardiaceae bacterium]|jgi:ABC-2 type transport system ATP-binding protein
MDNAAGEIPAVDVRGLTRCFDTGSGLRKRGRTLVAIDGIDLRVDQGEVHGLLGPNGAGKTTLCKILSTVLLPTAGTVRVLGHDVRTDTAAVRAAIGIVFGGERGLYGRLTARQNIEYWGSLYGLRRAAARERATELLARVGLADRADERVEGFSRGMKQRVHLARGLVAEPRVLLLDEPTTGMDPVASRDFRVLIEQLRNERRTVLITTHDMVEAEQVCDRVSFINGGRILATEPPSVLGDWITRFERVDVAGLTEPLCATLAGQPGVGDVSRLPDGRARFETTETGAAARLVTELVSHGVTNLAISRPSLEEVYVHLFGTNGMAVRR